MLADNGGGLDLAVPHQRANVDAVCLDTDFAQSRQTLQVDEVIRREQALLEKVDQRGAAGHRSGRLSVRVEQLQRFVYVCRCVKNEVPHPATALIDSTIW